MQPPQTLRPRCSSFLRLPPRFGSRLVSPKAEERRLGEKGAGNPRALQSSRLARACELLVQSKVPLGKLPAPRAFPDRARSKPLRRSVERSLLPSGLRLTPRLLLRPLR